MPEEVKGAVAQAIQKSSSVVFGMTSVSFRNKSVSDDLGLETLKLSKEAMDKSSFGLSVKISSLPHTPPTPLPQLSFSISPLWGDVQYHPANSPKVQAQTTLPSL